MKLNNLPSGNLTEMPPGNVTEMPSSKKNKAALYDDRPIGIFDSGLGGLTILRELVLKFPNEKYIYLGDTARLPYGNKSPQTIKNYLLQNIEFLFKRSVKAIIVACNSASTQVDTRDYYGIPLYNVIDPGITATLKVLKKLGYHIPLPHTDLESGGHKEREQGAHTEREQCAHTNLDPCKVKPKVGIIGTRATIQSLAYEQRLQKKGIETFSQPCPLFVSLVEEGHLEGNQTKIWVDYYLNSLATKSLDLLILGCTHYPLLTNLISDKMGPNVFLLDSGSSICDDLEKDFQIQRLLPHRPSEELPASENKKQLGINTQSEAPTSTEELIGSIELLSTDFTPQLEKVAHLFLKNIDPLPRLKRVDLQLLELNQGNSPLPSSQPIRPPLALLPSENLDSSQELTIAIAQMSSTNDLNHNLDQIKFFISELPLNVRILFFPENCLFQRKGKEDQPPTLSLNSPIFFELQSLAKKQNVALHLGSVPIPIQDKESFYNASIWIPPSGDVQISYKKIHLFEVLLKDHPPALEADLFSPGDKPKTISYLGWNFGQSICYDLRFSDLFLSYARQKNEALLIPASFLIPTGKAHWEILLRARAIESQSYVIAAAQSTEKTYGHSMVIDPWGKVLVESLKIGPELLTTALNKQYLNSLREQMPMHRHRRLDLLSSLEECK